MFATSVIFWSNLKKKLASLKVAKKVKKRLTQGILIWNIAFTHELMSNITNRIIFFNTGSIVPPWTIIIIGDESR